MIALATADVTVLSKLMGGVGTTTTTNTLFVSSVRIDFTTGAMYAVVQRGTVVNGVFTSNMDSLSITVNPDGSFVSTDLTWQGMVSSAPGLVAQLKATFDQFILGSGKVTGAVI